MIKRAVDQRPDDGYIVVSLGWAFYRIGNYEDAVKNLERAIDLKPEDPTINDHLGDAYWRIGRTLRQVPVGPCPRPEARGGGIAEDEPRS